MPNPAGNLLAALFGDPEVDARLSDQARLQAMLEVEAALAEHPRVAEVAVVGVPDEECGEVPVAFVRTRGAALTSEELLEHARAVLAPYQVPRRVVIVDELPRTGPGKVDKKSLQARARGG